jgi:hypothetical protein
LVVVFFDWDGGQSTQHKDNLAQSDRKAHTTPAALGRPGDWQCFGALKVHGLMLCDRFAQSQSFGIGVALAQN